MSTRTACLLALVFASPALAQEPLPGQPPLPSLPGLHDGPVELRQKAWDDPSKHRGARQQAPGYREIVYHYASVPVLATRTGMVTSITLDPDETIDSITVGDPTVFEVSDLAPNAVLVRPTVAGVDSNLLLLASSGRSYSFVLQSYGEGVRRLTDVKVNVVLPAPGRARIGHRAAPGAIGPHRAPASATRVLTRRPMPVATKVALAPDADSTLAQDRERLRSERERRLRSDAQPGLDERYANLVAVGFDPSRMKLDLSARASSEEAREVLGPYNIFRDDHWTYVDFGPGRPPALQRWPSVALVQDGTEVPIESDRRGARGELLVAKAVGPLVLRSGDLVVCIDLDAPRRFAPEPVARTRVDPALVASPGAVPAPHAPRYVLATTGVAPGALAEALEGVPHVSLDASSGRVEGLARGDALALVRTLRTAHPQATFRLHHSPEG